MERRELESTAARGTYLRGLLSLPLGLLFLRERHGHRGDRCRILVLLLVPLLFCVAVIYCFSTLLATPLPLFFLGGNDA